MPITDLPRIVNNPPDHYGAYDESKLTSVEREFLFRLFPSWPEIPARQTGFLNDARCSAETPPLAELMIAIATG
jgi:hypothetical protein